MHDHLIILAAGASSRMKKQVPSSVALTPQELEQANSRSKALISIDQSGRPLLDYLLINAQKAGYKHIYIVTPKDNQLFKEMYPDKHRFRGITIQFAIQFIAQGRTKPLGTADAVYQTMLQYPILKTSSFTVCNSDNLYSVRAFKLLRSNCTTSNALISYDRDALQFSKERISKFAIMECTPHDYLTNIIEKLPLHKLDDYKDNTDTLRVSMNIFRFNGELFFEYLENCPINSDRDEKELPSALMRMIKDHPMSTIGIPISEHVPDLTSKDDILMLKKYIKNLNFDMQ